MLERIADLARQLDASQPLSADEIEHAATALQALTVILVTRDVRAETEMPRWETAINARGQRVKRLRSEIPPTPEEAAEDEQRLAEMLAARQPPAPAVWDEESTIRSAGRPMSKAEYQAYLRQTGRVEISSYDARNGTAVTKQRGKLYTEAEMAELVQRAIAHGQQTGQITNDNQVVENAPLIPLPVVERPDAIKPRPAPPAPPEPTNEPPFVQEIPLEKRKPVNTAPLEKQLYENAIQKAVRAANARTGGI